MVVGGQRGCERWKYASVFDPDIVSDDDVIKKISSRAFFVFFFVQR
jgi:Fe-S cluster assembly iron-binding protein IscA